MIFEKLKELRLLKHLKQSDVAEALHISSNTYSMIECGKTKLDIDRVNTLCEFYNITIDKFFNYGVSYSADQIIKNNSAYIQIIHEDYQEAIELLKQQINIMKEELSLLKQALEHIIK